MLTTSSTCVCRSTPGCARWKRSPRPVSVGVCTLCPGSSSSGTSFFQHQPPSQAGCTKTKTAIPAPLSAVVGLPPLGIDNCGGALEIGIDNSPGQECGVLVCPEDASAWTKRCGRGMRAIAARTATLGRGADQVHSLERLGGGGELRRLGDLNPG